MIKIVCSDNCPYCDMAKNLLTSLWVDYEEINITWNYDKLNEIISISYMRTVPQIFVWEIKKENLLWWYSDIKSLHDQNKLLELIK